MRIDDGLITGLHAVRGPEQLSRIERETTVGRRVSDGLRAAG
ncbi:hypothetical protein [Streptomyces sp. NPDC055681]